MRLEQLAPGSGAGTRRKPKTPYSFVSDMMDKIKAQAPPSPAAPSPPAAQQPATPSYPGGASTSSNQGAADYFRGISSPSPEWRLSEEEMLSRAAQFADMGVDPRVSATQRSLEQAEAHAQDIEGRIMAAFAGHEQRLGEEDTRQAARDLESAIARGGGRSGAVEWLGEKRQRHFGDLISDAEGRKSAELTAIANQLGVTRKQAEDMLIELEELRGGLQQSHLAHLRDQQYQRETTHGMDQWGRALDVFDRTMMTPYQQLLSYFQGADTAGQFPHGIPNYYGGW